ncbi:CIA30 family protein [Arenicella xantha]|uniref:Complex I intermediate-associated protein 30 (CIA30) n=1 Tax=Arenicella xantha TaxID=644221 RepID=A0A395JLQ7_9GAMM|nr:CIA30 family protein [Arenicella xantha]RBP51702.1 complex I intermediate-associated protein 30 (CIA30) [Arenicella xantha]
MRFDFGAEQGVLDWRPVFDQVMGGESTGQLTVSADHLQFSGLVSLQNNGGFASLRSPTADYDLSKFQMVTIRYRASGQSFALTLNQHAEYFKPRFKAVLPHRDGEWHTDTIAFDEFMEVRLGERLAGRLTEQALRHTIRVGLISNDKVAGQFELDVDYIEFK